jgi:hypothetical protein
MRFQCQTGIFDKKKNFLGTTSWFVNSFSKETIDSLNNGDQLFRLKAL